ncbi:MAG: hypothetical protein ACREP9_22735, partial [Candidatus Dormibacteraceae bacterium]
PYGTSQTQLPNYPSNEGKKAEVHPSARTFGNQKRTLSSGCSRIYTWMTFPNLPVSRTWLRLTPSQHTIADNEAETSSY